MIIANNITKSFGSLQVLKGVNLQVKPSEIVSIMGASGAGKTTLLQILGTLETPDSGSVVIDGVDVGSLRKNELSHFRNKKIGFVFQFHQLLPEFSALENVMIPALIGGASFSKAEKSARELLTYLDLTNRVEHKPSQLSGGEKQRVAVARNYSGSPLGTDTEMLNMFNAMNEIIAVFERHGIVKGREKLLSNRTVIARRTYMNQEFTNKGGHLNMSPLSATIKIPTHYLLNYLSQFENANYSIGELLRSRDETIIYKVNAAFRGDPYPGALAAIDYLLCREGKSFEERRFNLVLAWSDINIDDANQTIELPGTKGKVDDFVKAVQASENKNILSKDYADIANHEIPRYYMQVRYGSTYSKVKHIRVFSYFADAILFPDGALWRDA
jgi:predicted ABC-type transport system involved in lysophospholipase L1 biosynthesis ATPase subunit